MSSQKNGAENAHTDGCERGGGAGAGPRAEAVHLAETIQERRRVLLEKKTAAAAAQTGGAADADGSAEAASPSASTSREAGQAGESGGAGDRRDVGTNVASADAATYRDGANGAAPSKPFGNKSAENDHAEEEKVEVVAAEEPIFYGSNPPGVESNSGGATSNSSTDRPAAATDASTELPWHEAKQRGGRPGNRRGKRAVAVPPVSSAAPPDAGTDGSTEADDDWVAQKQRPRSRKSSANAAAGQSAAAGHCNTSESESAPSSSGPEPVAREDGEDRAAVIDVEPGRGDATPRPGAYHVAGTGGPTNNASDPRSASDALPVGGDSSAPQENDVMVTATLVPETDDDIGEVFHAKPVTWKDIACHQYVRLALAGIALVAISLGVGLGVGLRPPPPTAAPTSMPTVSAMPSTAPTDAPSNSPTEYVWCPSDIVVPSDGAAGDNFGDSVAIHGDTVVVGAGRNDDNGEDSGSAYIFTLVGTAWEEQAKLLPSDGAADDFFGGSVAIHDDTVVVGATGDDDNGNGSGSAYVFTRAVVTWEELGLLLPSDGAAGDRFGGSVAIHGDAVVVGARYDADNGDYSGSAHVFTRAGSTWTQQKKLLAKDGAAYVWFGQSVGLDGNTTIVGAPYDGSGSGSVHIIELC